MLVGSVLLSQPVRAVSRGALLVGAHASTNDVGSARDCVIPGLPDSPACPARYPSHVTFSVLGGWAQRADQGLGARLVAGPSYVRREFGPDGFGFLVRADGAKPLSESLSVVLWVEGQTGPQLDGNRLSAVSGGIGLRIR